VVTGKRVETIEKKQDNIPTSRPGDTVDRVDDKKQAAETDKPVEKFATRRPATTWMDNNKWGGASPHLGSTDDFFERRLRLLNRKGVEATNNFEIASMKALGLTKVERVPLFSLSASYFQSFSLVVLVHILYRSF
jgi:hypothetical protein